MRIRQLEGFHAVMLCQTVTKASEMLHISQPAMTRLIADLEESVKFALFDRVRGRLVPTPEAHQLYEEVKQSLIGVDQIARRAQEILHQKRGALLIAAAPALSLSFLPKVTARFIAERPDTHIVMLSHSSRTVVDMVVGHACDVGFAILPMNKPSTHAESLVSTRIKCAVPRNHRLASHAVITPLDLKGEHFASVNGMADSRLRIDSIFAAHGVERIIRFESQISQALCSFVEAGDAVALVDVITASEYRGDAIRFVRFEPAVRLDFTVLMPAQRRPPMLAQTYVDFVRKHVIAQIGADDMFTDEA
jgi:DNA-binding transcriptional LysR family regulator